ncbi:YqjF family protein [Halorhabdus rudnickae]|uniref:YqjF family protein n=1 Tax=Halorhabdus rudnickae TaxID=1775544 RepID=UPI0010834736|nr:DUF2071 domain-containing protein [Halorhabdus rudnickae]
MPSSGTQRDVLTMAWRDVFFAHWPVDPTVLEATLPDGLTVDTFDGQAWLGIVGFRMDDIRPRFVPIGRSFQELNLRTYVRHDDVPGVYFYNLDADDRLGVAIARRLFGLPYYRAEMTVSERDGETRFRSQRHHSGAPDAAFDATIRPRGEPESVESGTLEAFLVERYRFFTERRGSIAVGEIEHEPWPLQDVDVTIEHNTLFEASGFDSPDGDPHLLYSPGIDVTAGWVRNA